MFRLLSQASKPVMMAGACGMPGLEMMPTELMAGIKQELPIAFRSEYRTRHNVGAEPELPNSGRHSRTSSLMQRGVSNYPSFSNLAAFQLKLWFHQDYHLAVLVKQSGKRGHN